LAHPFGHGFLQLHKALAKFFHGLRGRKRRHKSPHLKYSNESQISHAIMPLDSDIFQVHRRFWNIYSIT
jgi:hypothetical protein